MPRNRLRNVDFEELCRAVAEGPDLSRFSRKKAFGRDGLMLDGKAVLCSDPEGVVFRVGPEGEQSALAVAGARRWSPMGERGGPKGWVVVPPSAAADWPRLADSAVAYVKTFTK